MAKISLTSLDAIEYLISNGIEAGDKMKGSIRPHPRHRRCPSCNELFQEIARLGYICPANCKTKPDRFQIDLYYSGKRVQIYSDKKGESIYSYKTAFDLLAHIQYEIKNHVFDPSKYITSDIKKFLFESQIERFLEEKEHEKEKGNLSPTYISSLKNYINNYYFNYFKGEDVRDIKSIHIREFYNQLPKKSEKTYKNIMDALRHFFRTLHRYEIIDRVPAFPIIRVSGSIPSWTSVDNQLKLLSAIPDMHKPIFIFIFFQGVRPSEARALKWLDLDFENGIVIVCRTFSETVLVERTKGRNVKPRLIHPEVMYIFESMEKGLPESFVFINKNTGKHYSRKGLSEIFDKARKAVGLDITLYEAGRHSTATNAAMSGVDARIIRDYLGHADIRTTDKYTHLDVISQKQIFEKAKVRKIHERVQSGYKKK